MASYFQDTYLYNNSGRFEKLYLKLIRYVKKINIYRQLLWIVFDYDTRIVF